MGVAVRRSIVYCRSCRGGGLSTFRLILVRLGKTMLCHIHILRIGNVRYKLKLVKLVVVAGLQLAALLCVNKSV